MDWSKVKNVLIVVFMILNAFLLINIIAANTGDGVSNETLANTKSILEARGFVLKCGIPDYNSDSVKLNYETSEYERVKIAGLLLGKEITGKFEAGREFIENGRKVRFNPDMSIEMEDPGSGLAPDIPDIIKKTYGYIEQRVNGTGIPLKNYKPENEYDKLPDGGISVTYIERYKDYLVYDNYIRITIFKNRQVNLKLNYNKVTGVKKENLEGTKPIPVYQILLSEFVKDRAAIITGIDLGFKGDSVEQGSKVVNKRPVWRIKIEGQEPEYYNVYDGDRIN